MANVLEFQDGELGGGGEGFIMTSSPWQTPPIIFPPLPPLPPPIPSLHPFYGDIYSRRAASSSLQFAYEGGGGGGGGIDHLGLAGLYNYMGMGGVSSTSSLPFGGHHAEMSAQEIMDAKALAASKSHSEAERRRRERINAHLAKLRSLLPSTTKTDKASLLAEVIQHVKELRRQTSEIAEESPLPTESDDLVVDTITDEEDDGRFLIRASLCCEDRPDLLPDLIKALKSLRLKTLKAEITTLGGRVRKVLVITAEDDSDEIQPIEAIQDALKAVMERPCSADESSESGAGIKRQRTVNLSNILQHGSI